MSGRATGRMPTRVTIDDVEFVVKAACVSFEGGTLTNTTAMRAAAAVLRDAANSMEAREIAEWVDEGREVNS